MTTTEKCSTGKCSKTGRWTVIFIVLAVAVAILIWATMEQRKSILKTAQSLGNCNTFVDCVQKAGLTGVLDKDGPFSVFIPTDTAFANLSSAELTNLLDNKSALTALLLYHMVPKKMEHKDMENLKDCLTCTVPQTSIACTSQNYGKGKYVQSAIPCTNGVIFLIDTVQVPSFLNNQGTVEEEDVTIVETTNTTPVVNQKSSADSKQEQMKTLKPESDTKHITVPADTSNKSGNNEHTAPIKDNTSPSAPMSEKNESHSTDTTPKT